MTNTLKKLIARLQSCDEGATLVEYGIALGIAVSVGAGALLTCQFQVQRGEGCLERACTYVGLTTIRFQPDDIYESRQSRSVSARIGASHPFRKECLTI